MPSYLIFGGSGYIGTKLAESLLEKGNTVYVADIKESALKDHPNVIFNRVDVRNPISTSILKHPVEWIFNFAAIHREPGHEPHEYYDTNLKGAENVCKFATKVGCTNIFFTASISVYGPTVSATSEYSEKLPNTPYGISKLQAEEIHKQWVNNSTSHRLVIVRPGVIYGPGDPGNILRMIRAVKKGYFFLPVTPQIKKSYGYIYGLIESMDFAMNLPDKVFTYNYVEQETECLGALIKIINQTLGFTGRIIRIPFRILQIVAGVVYRINPNLNGIHPERVKKVARPTHILPRVLQERNFVFNYDFSSSLLDWKRRQPSDF